MKIRTPGSVGPPRIAPEAAWVIAVALACAGLAAVGMEHRAPGAAGALVPAFAAPPSIMPRHGTQSPSQAWLLNNPRPTIIPEDRTNPVAVADKHAARVRSMEERAALRAYEGAPPLIPHSITDLNIQSCRECHASGLVAGDKVARMASHTHLVNCTQCHVEAESPIALHATDPPGNVFAGYRASGYGSTRAWAGAPPVIPHTTFLRTNCVSCHGEHGYDGWRPDHLARTNCVQCHAPSAEFDQLAPTFGLPTLPDGLFAAPPR